MQCCTGNGTQGLYYAWEAAVRGDGPRATVNLLLNRASPVADVDSFLPREGRIVVRPRTARRLAVRMPRWVSPGDVKLRGASPDEPWIGRYLVADVDPGAELELEFPLPEEKRSFTVEGILYTCRFRGNDCVSIEPRSTDPGYYPMYVDKMSGPPTREVERYISPVVLPW
jgi:hypothetical protein